MNMALDLFFDPEADQELRNTKKFKFEDEDEEEETYRKISGLSRFFYPKKPNFLTPNEFKSDEEFVKNCYFSINQICNGSTLFPKFIKHYYKDATKFMRMLEVHKVYEGEGEEVEIEEPELHEYKVHLYSNYPKDYLLADIMHYIKLKLKMYTHEAKKTIEMALWKRECILINEINEMLYDITNFTGQMQTK
ncbi:hypothetical protein BaOVIS_017680 [Babesia ovis]|uniref:Uncharacterized protein n=1 Tax=Babesia ovis TaxID=5869 RepID=A0A9W5TA49_BABOV|nr:hypothetical protein BaOVIS_017680 [Babesia ovis]